MLSDDCTRSAASDSRRSGPAMVPASSSDRMIVTVAATSAIRSIPQRSVATMESISPGCVDSSNTPTVARTRCTGTATEMISWRCASIRTTSAGEPLSAAATSG